MNAERLLAHYEQIADAPDAIGRLRRFILDLAVRGKLVPQGAKDEAAEELLKRISSETLDQGDLPKAWCRARVGAFLDFQYGKGLSATERTDSGAVPVFGSNGIVGYTEKPLTVRPSIIVGRKGSAGALNLCGGPSWTTDVAYFVEAPSFVTVRFLLIALASMDLDKLGKGVKPGLSRSDAYEQVMCIPPLAEQHRIVAKVDELMALCDRLEAARAEREAARDRLTASSLARLNAPDPETFQDDARFVLNALPALTTRPDQIKQLRQTILNLAVRGKLVPQDLKDEPASELLKRITKEKAKSTGRNKILPEIETAEKTFDAPKSWQWVRMGNVFSIRTGFAFKSSTYANKGTLVFRVTNFDRDGSFDLSDAVFFPTEMIDSKMSGFLMKPGEIIMVMVGGTIGKTTIVDESILPALLNQNMWRIRSFGGIMSSKFEYLLVRNINQSIQGLTQSTHGHFAMSDYEKRVFPLPPLAEQHRIVAKIDELMAVCDRLEASLTATDATRRRLLDALLAEALMPGDGIAA